MAIRLERLRVREALNARDVAVRRLAEACTSVRQKTEALAALREEKEALLLRLRREDGGANDENRDTTNPIAKPESTGDVRMRLVGCLKAIENKLASMKISEGNGTTNESEDDYRVSPSISVQQFS